MFPVIVLRCNPLPSTFHYLDHTDPSNSHFLPLLSVTFPDFPYMHMRWYRIKLYGVDNSFWRRKVMSQVDLHACLHVCERGGRGSTLSL